MEHLQTTPSGRIEFSDSGNLLALRVEIVLLVMFIFT